MSDQASTAPAAELEQASSERVGPKLASLLTQAFVDAKRAGHIPPRALIDQQRARFREKFGPEALSRLDGEALLLHMHARGNHDSLVYWIEFKDDEEFGGWFGSITGGSALKFGLYQSSETQEWITGSPQKQTALTLEAAVALARDQRSQLVAADGVLNQAEGQVHPDFAAIQAEIERVAPELHKSIWAHKYLSLLHPRLVSAFHAIDYQRYQLTKLIQPSTDKRYENAGGFYHVAAQLEMTMLELCIALRQAFGAPGSYWRIGTTAVEQPDWAKMRDGGYMGLTWDVPDLSRVDGSPEGAAWLKGMLASYDGERRSSIVTRELNELTRFIVTASVGDKVIATTGAAVVGIGEITGPYEFADAERHKHRRSVRWLSTEEWRLPEREGWLTTFSPVNNHNNLLDVEARLLGVAAPTSALPPPKPAAAAPGESPVAVPLAPLTGVHQRIDAALNRKGQVILYGPPGTGKTYSAQGAANEILARSWFGVAAAGLSEAQANELRQAQALSLISFHPGYGYEDFIEGYRPQQADGGVAFGLRDGLLKGLAKRAAQQPKRKFILIIDEINRGDVPRIFGELLTILEKDKRSAGVLLPLSAERFLLPDNVLLIGTMNTADRSIALLDAALRRRFGFIELMPDHSLLGDASVAGLPLGEWLRRLNERIVTELGRDTRNLQIGHSYLLHKGSAISSVTGFADALRDEIIPLLQEYCYEDYSALQSLLGKDLVDSKLQLIREEVLAVGQHDRLIQSLLSAFDGITASASAVRAQAKAEERDLDVEEEGDDETELAET